MIRIVVDSTCDLPTGYAKAHGVTILPLHVTAEGKTYRDRVDITTEEVYGLMRRGIMPTTAQVNLAEAYAGLEELVRGGDDLVCLMFSAKMSGTCQNVLLAGRELEERYPERKIRVLDAKGGSFATGLIAMEAVRGAEGGMELEELVKRCEFLISQVEHVFVITDLNWMIRGGRISRTMGFTANLLNIKPVLDVDDGEMEVIRKVRGTRQSMEAVADLVAERAKNCPRQTIGITHADDPAAAETMRQMLHARLPECDFLVEEIGAVLGVHLGIGGVGAFFFRDM